MVSSSLSLICPVSPCTWTQSLHSPSSTSCERNNVTDEWTTVGVPGVLATAQLKLLSKSSSSGCIWWWPWCPPAPVPLLPSHSPSPASAPPAQEHSANCNFPLVVNPPGKLELRSWKIILTDFSFEIILEKLVSPGGLSLAPGKGSSFWLHRWGSSRQNRKPYIWPKFCRNTKTIST